MRILVINQKDEGGATAAAKDLMVSLGERGHELRYMPDRGGEAELREEIASFRPEILHFHCWYGSYPFPLVAALAEEVPSVFTVHDTLVVNQYGLECWECFRNAYCFGCPTLEPLRRFRPNYRMLDRWRKRRVGAKARVHLAYPSQWMKRRLARSEWAAKPSSVIPYGIDTDRFAPGAASRDRFGIGPAPTALFVGNMYSPHDHRKGLPDLLAAFEAVRRAVPDAQLLIAGRITGVELPPFARLAGELARSDLPDLYRSVDLLVCPSRGDNLPVAVLEALASGLPVVGTRIGGIPEEIGEGEGAAGVLVDLGDAAGLATGISDLLLDVQRCRSLGRIARERATSRFSRELCADRHETLFRGLVTPST